jgi:hypothetical protein
MCVGLLRVNTASLSSLRGTDKTTHLVLDSISRTLMVEKLLTRSGRCDKGEYITVREPCSSVRPESRARAGRPGGHRHPLLFLQLPQVRLRAARLEAWPEKVATRDDALQAVPRVHDAHVAQIQVTEQSVHLANTSGVEDEIGRQVKKRSKVDIQVRCPLYPSEAPARSRPDSPGSFRQEHRTPPASA